MPPTYSIRTITSSIHGGAADPVDARLTGTTDQTLGGRTIGVDLANDLAYFDANGCHVYLCSGEPDGHTFNHLQRHGHTINLEVDGSHFHKPHH